MLFEPFNKVCIPTYERYTEPYQITFSNLNYFQK